MTTSTTLSPGQTQRLSGLLYLTVVVSGIFSLMYVQGQLVFSDDPTRTFQATQSNQGLFRAGIAASVLCYLAFLLLPLALYQLLHHVQEWAARLMVLFAVVGAPMALMSLKHQYAVLGLLSDKLPAPELQLSRMTYELEQYNNGLLLTEIFWGLWLLPFGYLVYKSGFLPKILGILLMTGCFSYLVNFFGFTLIDGYKALGIAGYIQIPASLGEIGTCLWLLLARYSGGK